MGQTRKTTRDIEDRNGPDLGQAFQKKKWWVKPGFMANKTSPFHCDPWVWQLDKNTVIKPCQGY